MYKIGEQVRIINKNLKTYGCIGEITGCHEVEFSNGCEWSGSYYVTIENFNGCKLNTCIKHSNLRKVKNNEE